MAIAALTMGMASPAWAQHEHHAAPVADVSPWTFMQDGVVFGLYNNQGGPRGGDEFKVPNWWMGMLSRKVGTSDLTFTAMLSLDPATVGKSGYREIFFRLRTPAGAMGRMWDMRMSRPMSGHVH